MKFKSTAKLLASSITYEGDRLDTLQLRYWRGIHAEVMTHRQFSRNASSSRAIPVSSMTAREDIFIPNFARNKGGMQAGEPLSAADQELAEAIWRRMADYCLEGVKELAALNVHKQWANRPLEWFGYIDVVISSTEWSNWDALRDHPDAQPEIQELAIAMKAARDAAQPELLALDDWHLPYIDHDARLAVQHAVFDGSAKPLLEQLAFAFGHPYLEDLCGTDQLLIAVSAARCCRVSYAKHDGEPTSLADDVKRFCLLAQSTPKHASPLEHQARDLRNYEPHYLSGNFTGFAQFRKFVPQECL